MNMKYVNTNIHSAGIIFDKKILMKDDFNIGPFHYMNDVIMSEIPSYTVDVG